MKRKIIIIILIIILILVIVGIFIYFQTKKAPEPETKSTLQQGSINELFEEKMKFPLLSDDEKYFLFYIENEGIFQRNIDGSQKIKLYSLNQLEEIIWSPNKTKALVKINEEYNLFDIQKRNLIQLSQNILNANWAGSDEKIIYHYFDPNKNLDSFNLANPDGSDWKIVTEIAPGDYEIINYQEGKLIYFKTITDYRKDLMLYGGQHKLLMDNGYFALVSPEKQVMAVTFENKCFQINLGNDDKKDLEIKSGIDKIAVSPDGKLSFIASSQDNASDKFFRIILENSKKEEVSYNFEKLLQTTNLMVSKDNKTIYFLSGDYIYKLSL